MTMQMKPRLPSISGLRGCAALLVFWYHARWQAGDPSLPLGAINLRDILLACDGGVGIFFVLSGFLLSNPYWRNLLNKKPQFIELQPYFIRRIMRIAPAYYLTLAHTHLFTDLTYTFWGAISFALHLLGLHTLLYQSHAWGVNPVLWSIGVEAQFYVVLPILFLIAKAVPGSHKYNGLSSLLVIGLLCFTLDPIYRQIIVALAPHLPVPILGGENAATSPVISLSVFYFLKWFGIGILFSWLDQIRQKNLHQSQAIQINPSPWIANICFILSLAGVIWIFLNASEAEWRNVSLYGWPLNCLFFGGLILTAPTSTIGRWLFDNPVITFIGEISYGIYLWHLLIQVSVFDGSLSAYFTEGQYLLVGGCISFAITVLIAALSFYFLEQPAVRIAQRCRSFGELWQELRSRFQFSS